MLYCDTARNQEVIKRFLYEKSLREFQLNPRTVRRLNSILISVKCGVKAAPKQSIKHASQDFENPCAGWPLALKKIPAE